MNKLLKPKSIIFIIFAFIIFLIYQLSSEFFDTKADYYIKKSFYSVIKSEQKIYNNVEKSQNSSQTSTIIITLLFTLFIIRGYSDYKKNIILTNIFSLLYISYYFIQMYRGIYTAPITPLLIFHSTAHLKKLYEIITVDKNTEIIKNAMVKYISKDVMKKVLSNPDKLKLGGIRTVVTILFVDIRNFTSISEDLTPSELTSLLNEYFSVVEPIIEKHKGIINKYIGDGILAVFGEPINDINHAKNSIICAKEILYAVSKLKEKFESENRPLIEAGIAINTGEVFAGNIGTEDRFEYTVIGDNVNLAARIESLNQTLKTQFLISSNTYEYVKDIVDVVKLSQVKIKGKSKPMDIYEVLKVNYEN